METQTMRYVITGGGGFIGSHLAEKLRKEVNDEIVVIDKISNHGNTNNLNMSEYRYYLADIADSEIMMKALQKDDIVFHLAAQPHVDLSYVSPMETTISNVLGTHSVLNSCQQNEVKSLTVMSTDEVYGSTNAIDSNTKLDPTNPYSATKAAADMMVNSYKHMYPDMKINTLRSNNIIGPRQFIRNIIPRFSLQALTGRNITLHGKGEARRRYLWVEDAADALWRISKSDYNHKIYNIGHPEVYSNLDVAKIICDHLNVGYDIIQTTDDRIFNDTIYPYNPTDIFNDLGWSYTINPSVSIPRTIDWYKENIRYFEKFFDIL